MKAPRAETGRKAVVLLALALVPAFVAAWLHPRRPTWSWTRPAVAELTVADAMNLAPPVVWVDARPEKEYRERHVPGAISIDEARWEEQLPTLMQAWRPGMRVVVYCDSRKCDASREVAVRLRHELQIDNVFVLQGGWDAWREAQNR